MPHAFNENFYIVTATVNPLFFLALTLQGSFYESLIKRINAGVKLPASESERHGWKAEIAQTAFTAIWIFANVIPLAGFFAEFGSIAALYHQADFPVGREIVYWSTMGMIFLTAAIPGSMLLRTNLGRVLIAGMVDPFLPKRQIIRLTGAQQNQTETVDRNGDSVAEEPTDTGA
jgi:hypothetical protein